jgi:hypothetical protein
MIGNNEKAQKERELASPDLLLALCGKQDAPFNFDSQRKTPFLHTVFQIPHHS